LDRLRVAAIAAAVHGIAARRSPDELAPPGWRNVRSADQPLAFKLGDSDVELGYRPSPDGGFDVSIGGKTTHVSSFGVTGDRVWFVEHGGHRRQARVAVSGAKVYVLSEGQTFAFVEQPRFPDHAAQTVAGGLIAPMPGKVVKVLVEAGQSVAAGSPLLVLEAMKMEHTVRAADAGTVQVIHVAVGDQVDADRLLAVVQ
jgi:biotin carboxyl carrier protein